LSIGDAGAPRKTAPTMWNVTLLSTGGDSIAKRALISAPTAGGTIGNLVAEGPMRCAQLGGPGTTLGSVVRSMTVTRGDCPTSPPPFAGPLHAGGLSPDNPDLTPPSGGPVAMTACAAPAAGWFDPTGTTCGAVTLGFVGEVPWFAGWGYARYGASRGGLKPAYDPPQLPAANQAPTAQANGPYSGTVGSPVSFSSAGSNDPDGTIATYGWAFGDATTGSGPSPTHAYAGAGTYQVVLTVTDDQGATATSSALVTIVAANQPPVAEANGPYTGSAGTPVALSSSGSSDADGTITSYAWSFGDGGNGTGPFPTHAYSAAGTYAVILTVTDDEGATDADTAQVVVSAPPPWCEKTPVQTELSPTGLRYPGNVGPDDTVRVHLGESLQTAIDATEDVNGDGYIIVAVVARDDGLSGGSATQSIVVSRSFTRPFGLIGCGVTLNDATPADLIATAIIQTSASAPPDEAGTGIFVMDLNAAQSHVAGWKVLGNGRYLRNVDAVENTVGFWFIGDGNTLHNATATENDSVGVLITGSTNTLDNADAFENGIGGIEVIGSNNTIKKSDLGDAGRGNGGHGLQVTGAGNQIIENNVFANVGSGIHVIATSGTPNVIRKNQAGDRNKGNGAHGIIVAGPGNGTATPIEIDENTTRSNTQVGIKVTGSGHQLKNNVSGGSGDQNNGQCEFDVASGNFNATGNTANGTSVPGSNGSPFPTGCVGSP
jgi:PKD repeat protein